MNESRRAQQDFFNPSVKSEKRENLLSLISSYMFQNQTTLKTEDWLASNQLIRNLKNPNIKLTEKVLKSTKTKFEKICQKYKQY